MNDEKKLNETLRQYQELAKTDKNIDVATLMISALHKQDENRVSSKAKKWTYLVSLLAPPFGLIFSIKYYFLDDRDDAKSVAVMSLVLTLVAVVGTWLVIKGLFSTLGVTPQQIEQIKPSDIMQLYQ